jgi:hypothetical protein
MTQDEIIEMAKEAGLLPCQGIHMGDLKAFAKLIAEKEREACAKLAGQWVIGYPHPSEIIADWIRARGQA